LRKTLNFPTFTHLFSISIDPRIRHTVWSALIGGTFNVLCTYGFNQAQIQRYMCVRTTRGAAQALFINAIGSGFILLSCFLIGIIIYAYYADCDPYTAKFISAIDQIFPYFVMEVLSNIPGVPGIFLACIFSGSLSTLSSGLNSLAAVIIEDVYKGLMQRELNDERQGFILKILSIILGAIVMLLTYVVSHLGPLLNASTSLFGVLQGPIMGVFFLGFFFPQANHCGGLVGFVSGVALPLWIFVGSQVTKNQRKSERLPLLTTNCTQPINETRISPTPFRYAVRTID
jgi:sodium-dependent multivitamin transporter 6